MIEAGGSIYLMIKIAGTVGQKLLQVGAQMRGETLEQFMATRPGERTLTWRRIVGGIGSSHAPSIAQAWDKGSRRTRSGRRCSTAMCRCGNGWRAAARPADRCLQRPHEPVLLRRLSDLRARRRRQCIRRRTRAGASATCRTCRGDPDFGWHLARSLVEDEFDPTICQEMAVDHGVMSVLPMLTDTRWPVADRAARGERDPASAADGAAAVTSWGRRCAARWRRIRRICASW